LCHNLISSVLLKCWIFTNLIGDSFSVLICISLYRGDERAVYLFMCPRTFDISFFCSCPCLWPIFLGLVFFVFCRQRQILRPNP
jgi:hypothetical protein